MKFQRQLKILELIESQEIETQDDLSEKLREIGFQVTQATVSRDIKELRLTKSLAASGKYRYASAIKEAASEVLSKYRIIFKESVIKVDYAMNIVVIKTMSGMAHAAAEAVDNMATLDIVGSIAGDNTIFAVTRSEESALKLAEELNKMLK